MEKLGIYHYVQVLEKVNFAYKHEKNYHGKQPSTRIKTKRERSHNAPFSFKKNFDFSS